MNLVRFAVAFGLQSWKLLCAATSVPLATTPGAMPPRPSITQGIAEYDVGHWSVARQHFTSAIKPI